MGIIIGIDPGKTGAAACIQDGDLKWVYPFAGDIENCRRVKYSNVHYFIEKVASSPNMGRVSAFTFGKWVEAVESAAYHSGSPIVMVRPQVWQNAIGVWAEGDKGKLYTHAQKLYPEQFKQKIFNKATSDAVLIAHYGWRYQVHREEKC